MKPYQQYFFDKVKWLFLMAVMPIIADIQDKYPELLKGIKLVDTYTPCDTAFAEIDLKGLKTKQVDWVLKHYNSVGDKKKTLKLDLSEPRSKDSDGAVKELKIKEKVK